MKIKLACFMFVALTASSYVSSQTTPEEQFLQNKVNKADAKLVLEQGQSDDLRKQLSAKKRELSELRAKNTEIKKELNSIAQQAAEESNQLALASARLKSLQSEIAEDRDLMAQIQSKTQELEAEQLEVKRQAEVASQAQEPQPESSEPLDEQVVLKPSKEPSQHSAEAEPQDPKASKEGGAVVKTAKAGGKFVQKEATNVVKDAARKGVRDGVRGLLGL